jgi:signal peptidase I
MLGNYLTSVINIALPSLLYIYSSRMISNHLNGKYKNIKILFKAILIDMPLFIFFTIFIGLISGFFKFHLIGVDTSEIKPIINVGDAVLINQKYNYESYKKGDIFVYKDGKKIIIDRITKVKNNNVIKNKIYITKEKTKGEEDTYKYIPNENILGKYENFKISKIAKPTIWFKKIIR